MATASETLQESVRIYRVLETAAILAGRDRLAQMFAGRPEDEDITFAITGDGARIWFTDNRIIWQTVDPRNLLRDKDAAEMAARSFVGRINLAVQKDREFAARGITRLFPDDLRASSTVIVNNPDSEVPDHWLVRFSAYLPTGNSFGSVPVNGSSLEIRLGTNGRIGSCWLLWRPCFPEGVTPLLSFTPAPSSNASSENDSLPALCYRMASEGTAQPYLSPYFFSQDDDAGSFFPASLFSPVGEIVNISNSDTIRVAAWVAGGSQQFSYRWITRDITQMSSDPFELGSDMNVELEPGMYNLILRVIDRVTGVVLFVERSIYTDMLRPPAQ